VCSTVRGGGVAASLVLTRGGSLPGKVRVRILSTIRDVWQWELSGARARVLSSARRMWQWDGDRLSEATCLTDSERDTLRRAVRHWCVRYAAYRASRLLELQLVGMALAAAACLLVPAAAVVVAGLAAGPSLSPAGLALAGATYLAVYGAASVVYFRMLGGPPWMYRPGWLVAGLSAVTALGVALVWEPDPWSAVRFGLAAVGIAIPVMIVGHMTALWLGKLFWFPLRHRVLGTISPSWIVAARLWYVLDAFEEAAYTWRRPATRRNLLGWVSERYWLQEAMPRAIWFAGCHRPAHAEATRRLQHAAAFVNSLAWRVADCTDQAEYDRIRRDLAEAAVATASGNWTPILAHPLPPRPSKARRFIRRLVPAGSLAAAALVLPHAPGLSLTDAQLTTIQAALFVGAVLSLTSVDQGAREQILDAFSDPHRRS
jgi:hypothetical protein